MSTQIDATREERYGATRRKNITITEASHQKIEEWAELNGTYFSVAIETLALVGMGVEDVTLLPRLVENVVERVFQRQFHRLAKLLAATAITAADTDLKVDALLLQLIRREALADSKGFAKNLKVSSDPNDKLAASIRRARDQMKAMTHAQAVARLKPSIKEVLLHLDAAAGAPAAGEVNDDG